VSVDYKKELDELEEIIRRIEYILGNRTTYPKHVEDIKDRVSRYRAKIMEIMNMIDQVNGELDNTQPRMENATSEIVKLRKEYEVLRILIQGQLHNLTLIEGKSQGHALNETQRSLEISNRALDISNDVKRILEESSQEREDRNNKVSEFKTTNEEIVEKLRRYRDEFGDLSNLVTWINAKLCGNNASVCGGCSPFNCDNCGGEGCDGAMPLSMKALEKATEAERALREKERKWNLGFLGVKVGINLLHLFCFKNRGSQRYTS
jgi:hypothetical protein